MRRATSSVLSLVAAGSVVVWGAGQAAPGLKTPGEMTHVVQMMDAKGQRVGSVTLRETTRGVLLSLDLSSLPPGSHALHVHAVGRCEAPTFESAGGHYNPRGTQHGFLAAKGAHAGDLPNVSVSEGGRLVGDVLINDVSLGAGSATLLDEDGSALVLHQNPDDYKTDPAGAAGARIACGVIAK